MTYRSQRAVLWWAVAFIVIYAIALAGLLGMVPPPSAKLNANEIAQWYAQHHNGIRIGAVIASWTSAFMIPLAILGAQQIKREEGPDCNVWTWCALIGGSMTSVFLVLPPPFWGEWVAVLAYPLFRAIRAQRARANLEPAATNV